MGKFVQELDKNYQFWKEEECAPESKLEYLGKIVFGFTTYSGDLDVLFAEKMLPVLRCIINRTNFEYIKDSDQHVNYIAMCNSPFLVDKLEWGTSIRGAWFDSYKRYEIDCGRIVVEAGEIKEFITDVIEWAEK